MPFTARLPRQLAQMLAVGIGELHEQFVQRIVAVVDEPVAPGFEPMQLGRLASRKLAIMVELCADRREFVLASPHHLGEILDLALACDLLGDAARLFDLVKQILVQRQLAKLRVAERDETLGQLEYGQCVAATLAATWRIVVIVFGKFVVVFAHDVVQCRQRRKG